MFVFWGYKRRENGNSLIELIVVMAMLGLLGGVLISLIATGGSIYQKVNENSDAQIEARLALSYITVKVRQNDVKDGVTVPTSNVIRILKPAPDIGYWDIYSVVDGDGKSNLVEDDYDGVPTHLPVTSIIAENVALTASMSTVELANQISLSLSYSNGTKNLNEIITLRSDGL